MGAIERRLQQAITSQALFCAGCYALVFLAFKEEFSFQAEAVTILRIDYGLATIFVDGSWDAVTKAFFGGQRIGLGLFGRLSLVGISLAASGILVIRLLSTIGTMGGAGWRLNR